MKLSNAERETIIVFNESDEMAEVSTYNGRMKRTLSDLATQRPADVQRIRENDDGGETYRVPKKWVKIRAKRILSDAQREALSNARSLSPIAAGAEV